MKDLLNQLTRKNQEYIYIASKKLEEDGKTQAEIDEIIGDVLPTIIQGQQNGLTARALLDQAPTAWAASFTETESATSNESQEKNSNPWLMWLNTSLLFLGILAIVNGLLASFSKSSQQQGILTLLAMGLFGGAAMYSLYYFIYQHAGKPKEERPSFWKTWGGMVAVFMIWVIAVNLVVFLPEAINPALPQFATVLIGIASLGLSYWLKRRYNIQSALGTEPRR